MRPKWPFGKHRASKMRLVAARCALRKHCYPETPLGSDPLLGSYNPVAMHLCLCIQLMRRGKESDIKVLGRILWQTSIPLRRIKSLFPSLGQVGKRVLWRVCPSFGNGPNTVSESTVLNTELSEFLALTELRGENSVSSSSPIICVPKRTHRGFSQSSPSLPQHPVS